MESSTAIKSLSPGFVKAVVTKVGRPDNFVDSPEGSFVGLPDIDADPAAREVIESLNAEVQSTRPDPDDDGGVTNGHRVTDSGSEAEH